MIALVLLIAWLVAATQLHPQPLPLILVAFAMLLIGATIDELWGIDRRPPRWP